MTRTGAAPHLRHRLRRAADPQRQRRRARRRFLPDGAEFFARLSKYDDYLVDVARKPGYNAGNTLRLIAPFLRAFCVGDDDVELFSAEQVLIVPKALETLVAIRALLPAFIISTSYTPYVRALCDLSGFPFDHVRCTELSLDAWEMPRGRGRVAARLGAARLRAPADRVPDRGHLGRWRAQRRRFRRFRRARRRRRSRQRPLVQPRRGARVAVR